MRASANQGGVARNSRLLRIMTAARRQCRRSALLAVFSRVFARTLLFVFLVTSTVRVCFFALFFRITWRTITLKGTVFYFRIYTVRTCSPLRNSKKPSKKTYFESTRD